MPENAIAASVFTPLSGLIVVVLDWEGVRVLAKHSGFRGVTPYPLDTPFEARKRYLKALQRHLRIACEPLRCVRLHYAPHRVKECLRSPDSSIVLFGQTRFEARPLVEPATINPDDTCIISFPLVRYTHPDMTLRSSPKGRKHDPILMIPPTTRLLIDYARRHIESAMRRYERCVYTRLLSLARHLERDLYIARRKAYIVPLNSALGHDLALGKQWEKDSRAELTPPQWGLAAYMR